MQDGRGEKLCGWQQAGQWTLADPEGPTWEREIDRQWRRANIDLVFYRGVLWVPRKGEKLSSNHWIVGGDLEVEGMEGEVRRREGIKWWGLEALLATQGEEWYHGLNSDDTYGKLRDLRTRFLKYITIGPRSKRWWDEELTIQAKSVRRARRGGI